MSHLSQLTTRMARLSQYVLLLIVAWTGPRPVIHSHDQFFRDGTSLREFSRHLSTWHSGIPGKSIDPKQQHCHWVMPSVVDCCSSSNSIAVNADECQADPCALTDCLASGFIAWDQSLVADQSRTWVREPNADLETSHVRIHLWQCVLSC